MLKLDLIQTLAFAGVVLFVGYGLRKSDPGPRALQHAGAGDRRPAGRRGRAGRAQPET